jgi:DnaJ-class molecular chaperone
MTADYYVILGVDEDASSEQIQAAYCHWASVSQSDPEVRSTKPLEELQRAYLVLAHPERRRAYDARRKASPHAEPLRAPAETPAGRAGMDISLRDSFGTARPSFEELFERWWSNASLVTRRKAERVESLTLDVPLSPEQATSGGQARVLIPARAQCPACAGHGAVGVYQCWHCGGQGSITGDFPLELSYPPGIANEHVVQVPLSAFGIENFYLVVRFRVTQTDVAASGA